MRFPSPETVIVDSAIYGKQKEKAGGCKEQPAKEHGGAAEKMHQPEKNKADQRVKPDFGYGKGKPPPQQSKQPF